LNLDFFLYVPYLQFIFWANYLIQANDSPIFVAGTGTGFNYFKRRQNPTASMQIYTTNMQKYVHTYIHTYTHTLIHIHTYIPWCYKCGKKMTGCGTVITTQIYIHSFYSIKDYKHFTKQYYKSSFHIQNSSIE